jgi:translation initiation factor IF-3
VLFASYSARLSGYARSTRARGVARKCLILLKISGFPRLFLVVWLYRIAFPIPAAVAQARRGTGWFVEDTGIAVTKRIRRNEEIDAVEVRVIDSAGEQKGVMAVAAAIELAKEEALDLVEVSPTADPPVCRIMDFGKHLFEQNKKAQVSKRKQKQVHIKEIKFRPGTEEGDYRVKLRKLVEFLENGDKTKITLRFRGREMAHQELGANLLARVRNDLEEYGIVEQMPQMEGRQMIMVMSPKKK